MPPQLYVNNAFNASICETPRWDGTSPFCPTWLCTLLVSDNYPLPTDIDRAAPGNVKILFVKFTLIEMHETLPSNCTRQEGKLISQVENYFPRDINRKWHPWRNALLGVGIASDSPHFIIGAWEAYSGRYREDKPRILQRGSYALQRYDSGARA